MSEAHLSKQSEWTEMEMKYENGLWLVIRRTTKTVEWTTSFQSKEEAEEDIKSET